jgi:hypothetical protein
MAIGIKDLWVAFNKALTITNLVLFGILTFNLVPYKEIRDKNVPVIANLILLLFLSLGLYAAIYKLK